MAMTTTTLYKIIQSELYRRGFNREIVDEEGNLVYFDLEQQNMTKIMRFDEDVKHIIDSLFMNALKDSSHDHHFKKAFMFKFLNRQINKQTVESFKFDLISTFMMNEDYINRVYQDSEKYIHRLNESESSGKSNTASNNNGESSTEQTSDTVDSSTIKNNTTNSDRKASSNLPNSQPLFNLESDDFDYPSTADASKNKGESNTVNSGTSVSTHTTTNKNTDNATSDTMNEESNISRSYTLDDLFKSINILENIFLDFDKKCFLQVW